MNAQPAIGYMTYQEDGEANRYTIHLDGDWLLSVQHNGRPLTERQKATLHRLAACWNACEGVPTEVLEAQQAGGLPWSVADQIDQRVQFNAYKEGSEEAFGAVVEQKRKAEECVSRMESTIQSQQVVIVKMRTQRDELLAALQGMLAIVSDSRGVDGYHLNGDIAEWDEFDEVNAARAAIAKATGEKA